MSDATSRFAVLKKPTFWVVVVLLIGFIYLQWPTHVRMPYAPDYRTVTLADGVQMQWEGEPQRIEGEAGTARNKRMALKSPAWNTRRLK